MTSHIKFSIIIPAYKSHFLQESIDSIINQTYPYWQLVIINDGSPYDLDSIINKYNDERIRYEKRNEGYGSLKLANNWNDCLKYVTGDYVINMGDDDILLPNCLQDYEDLITKYPQVCVFHGWAEIINEKSNIIDITEQHPKHESAGAFILRSWNGGDFYMGNILLKRSFLTSYGGYINFPYAWHSDHITAYQAAYEYGVVSTDRVVFGYRKHSATISNTASNIVGKLKADVQAKQWFENFLNILPSNGTEGIIKNKLLRLLPTWYEKRLALDIAECNKHSPWKIWFSWKIIREYKINIRTILRATIYSIIM